MDLVRILTGRGARDDPLARGARRRVHRVGTAATGSPLRGREPEAPAPGRRPHGPRDHERAARSRRGLERADAPEVAARASSSRPRAAGGRAAASTSVDAGAVVLAAGGRCYREAEERGELTTNHPGATGEVTQIALGLGAEARDLDALQYHPNGGAWPANMQGYSIPETTRAYGAVLLNAGRRGVHRLARPARRGLPGDLRRGREGPRGRDRRTAGRRSGSTRPGFPRRTPRSRCRTCSGATARPGSTRSRSRSSPIRCSTTRTAGS